VCRFSGTHESTQQVAHNANDDQYADSIKEPLVVVGKPLHAGILSSGFRETPQAVCRNSCSCSGTHFARSVVRWPNGKEPKAKIIRREKITPNRPQHA